MIAECLTFRVLREHGIATGATGLPRVPVAPESKAGRHATPATGATGQKYMEQREAPEPPQVQRPTPCNVIPLRRSVACRDCQHQQPRPDTSPAGLHPCGMGHGWHFANYPHACPEWKQRT